MKINLKQALKNLDGSPLKNGTEVLTLGEAIGNILSASEEGGKLKLYVLATKFATQESVDLDASDYELVKNTISKSRAYSGSLVTGQVELLLSEAK